MTEVKPERTPIPSRWTVRPEVVTVLVSLWFVMLCNAAFWGATLQAEDGVSSSSAAFLFTILVLVILLTNLLLTLVLWPAIGKPLLGLLLIAASVAAYFSSAYGVVIDRTMITNVVETDARETRDLITAGLLGYVAVLGVLPLAFLLRIRIAFASFVRELLRKALVIAATLLAIGAIVFSFNERYASLFRNHSELRRMLTPINYVAAIQSYVKHRARPTGKVQTVGGDARRSPNTTASKRRTLLVIVIGETARTANFSLGGYGRPTNPELAGRNVVFFSNVEACGTSTSISVPCLFSGMGRQDFSERKAAMREGLLDIIVRSGISVLWRDNNSGCKGVCDRVETEDMARLNVKDLCRDGECWDDVLVQGLQARLDRERKDLVILLHQKGSHGPAYYRRYPDSFQLFKPACQSSDLSRCSKEEIVNAYDNSILYTDHVLAQTIALLEKNSARFDSSLIYVSDHGESLGEKGLYLHGLPYVLAPEEQKKVPMIFWASSAFQRRVGLREGCLEANRDRSYSHDNVFHSVLGLLNIQTEVYQAELDVFRPCRGGGTEQ